MITSQLKNTEKELNKIKISDISELKNYKNPVPLIKFTLDAVMTLLYPNANHNWLFSKKKLGEQNFI